jgi:4-hydroxybenzoate polyprenyltransferase
MAARVSSTISSRISRSSCTSEAGGGGGRSGGPPAGRDSQAAEFLTRATGFVRLTHPFPILLDGIVTGALATAAGGGAPTAARLGAAMIALQASIGALNDVVDAERDRGLKPGKPIPRGIVAPQTAGVVVLVALALGLVLTAPSGTAALVVAVAGTASGYLYDLRLKGTALSWAPWAVGIALLPVYAWVGATGRVPNTFAVLVPAAAFAGAALAIANGLPDEERDRAAGTATVAVRLGRSGAWLLHAVLQVTVIAVALGALLVLRRGGPGLALALAGAAGIIGGVMLARDARATRRERGWELESIGLGVLAGGWLLAAG